MRNFIEKKNQEIVKSNYIMHNLGSMELESKPPYHGSDVLLLTIKMSNAVKSPVSLRFLLKRTMVKLVQTPLLIKYSPMVDDHPKKINGMSIYLVEITALVLPEKGAETSEAIFRLKF